MQVNMRLLLKLIEKNQIFTRFSGITSVKIKEISAYSGNVPADILIVGKCFQVKLPINFNQLQSSGDLLLFY